MLQIMYPFNTLAVSLNDEDEGAVNAMFAFVAVKLYDPLFTRVVNVPATFPLVDVAVVFTQ